MSRHLPLTVLHLASGDRWAGAEVQLYTLLSQLRKYTDIEPVAVLLNDGELAARLRAIDVNVEILDESKLSSLEIFTGLMQLLRHYKPHVLHTHRQKENILGTVANLLSIRARSVRTVHGANENAPSNIQQRLVQTLDRWTANHLQQRIIAVSTELAEKLKTHLRAENIVVVENGVDIDAVRAAVKPVDFREAEPNAIHIGLVGRLDPVKRIDIFLEMSRQLIREYPQKPWRFHVFGEGNLEQALKAQAATLGIADHVTFHGHRSDIAACLANLDAVVMCSDHEGLPMTALEALALGTPLIAHATGGLNELLKGWADGWLVHNHTAEGYKSAVLGALNPMHAASMKEQIDTALATRSATSNADQIREIYLSL